MQRHADAVIIGGGIAGCATAYYLARRGIKAVLCEKGEIAGEQSSRNWGFVRQQGRDPAEVPLMIECNRMWRGLEKELGVDLEWRQGGNLALAPSEKEIAAFEKWLEIARQYQMNSRILSNRQVRDLIPGIEGRWPGGLYTPGDGQAEPAKVAPAMAKAAAALGAEIRAGCAVDRILTEGGAVSGVLTEQGEIRARTVVCAAGIWSSRLLRMLGINLPQLFIRATVARTTPVRELTAAGVWGPEVAFRQRRDGTMNIAAGTGADYDILPDSLRHFRLFWANYQANKSFLDLRFGAEFFRALPELWAGPARTSAAFRRTRVTDPAPNPKRVDAALAGLRQVFPGLDGVSVTRRWAGKIDMMPDMIPVLDAVERPRGLVIATGLSGHGFGMGPIVGRLMAELIADGRPSLDIKDFRLSRFADGSDIKPRAVV